MQEDKVLENYFTPRTSSEEKTLWRPGYHFTAPSGWINDPNGLIYFRGWYHLFYQYNPYGCEWGSMHWGHAVSRDLFHWKDLPIALKPDRPYDDHPEGGCFSGSCIEHEGKLYAFYTSSVLADGKTVQTQSLAISEDGVHFEKYEKNPVIAKPPEGTSDDFRDPKVFRDKERWYMVLGGSVGGAEKPDGDGRIYLYGSDDLYHWSYIGNLLESLGRYGTMFECPDFFELNGKWVLTASPMKHPHYNKAICFVGDVDLETASFQIEKIGNMDHGFDYYASQSFLDENGERMAIAWTNGWAWMPWFSGWGPTSSEGWRGALSMPRRMILEEDLTLRLEATESISGLIESICSNGAPGISKSVWKEKELLIDTQRKVLPAFPESMYRLHLQADPKKVISKSIEIGLLSDGEKAVRIRLDLVGRLVILDRENADEYAGGTITAPIKAAEDQIDQIDPIDLTVFVDRSIIEVYVNGGRSCITTNVYPNEKQTGIWIRTPYREAEISLFEVERISRSI